MTPAIAAPLEAAGAPGGLTNGNGEQPAPGMAPVGEMQALPEAAPAQGGVLDGRPEPPEAGMPPMDEAAAHCATPAPAAAALVNLLGDRPAAPPAGMQAAVQAKALDAAPGNAGAVWEGERGGTPARQAAAKQAATGAASPGMAARAYEPGVALALGPPAAAEHGVHPARGAALHGEDHLLAPQQPAKAQRDPNGAAPGAAVLRQVTFLAPEQPGAAEIDASGAAPKATVQKEAHARGPGEPGGAAAPERQPVAHLDGAAGAHPPAGPDEVDTGPAGTAAHQQAEAAALLPPSLPETLARPWSARHAAEAQGAPSTGGPGEPGQGVESAGVAAQACMEPTGVLTGSGSAPGGAVDALGGAAARAHVASHELAAPPHEAGLGFNTNPKPEAVASGVASGAPPAVRGPMPQVLAGRAQAAAGSAAPGARAMLHELAWRAPACDVQAGALLSGPAAGAHVIQQRRGRRSHAACGVPVQNETAASPQGSLQEPAGRAQAADARAGSLADLSGFEETCDDPAGPHPAGGGEARARACSGQGAAPEETAGRACGAARRAVPGRKRKALGWVRVGRGWHPQRVRRGASVVDL